MQCQSAAKSPSIFSIDLPGSAFFSTMFVTIFLDLSILPRWQVLREGLHPDGRRQLRLIQIHQHLRITHQHFDTFVRLPC